MSAAAVPMEVGVVPAQPLFSLAEMAAASLIDPTPYIEAVLGNSPARPAPSVALEP